MKIGKQLAVSLGGKKTDKVINYLIILAFAVYLVLGIGIYRDYGISADEPYCPLKFRSKLMHRQSSMDIK